MPKYTYTVTQRVAYGNEVEFESPEEVVRWIEKGDGWDRGYNEVEADRVQVYDENDNLVADTDPDDCAECGRNENAGFVNGEPRCHRHLEGQ